MEFVEKMDVAVVELCVVGGGCMVASANALFGDGEDVCFVLGDHLRGGVVVFGAEECFEFGFGVCE